jgi:hypothetical protein
MTPAVARFVRRGLTEGSEGKEGKRILRASNLEEGESLHMKDEDTEMKHGKSPLPPASVSSVRSVVKPSRPFRMRRTSAFELPRVHRKKIGFGEGPSQFSGTW